jgi:hypothetical protein
VRLVQVVIAEHAVTGTIGQALRVRHGDDDRHLVPAAGFPK